MLRILRKILPEKVKKHLRVLRRKYYDPPYKRKIAKQMRKKHNEILRTLVCKQSIRVVFLVYNSSIWKVDSLFRKMLIDPIFDPIVFVYADMTMESEAIINALHNTTHYFRELGYPVISSYDHENNRWLSLKEIDADIVFFTDQSARSLDEYSQNAYLNYLGCFCGYGYIITDAPNKNIENYDLYFHNALWRNYVSDRNAFINFQQLSTNQGANTLLTGFPNIECLLNTDVIRKSWKFNDSRLKIIYAPHHSVESGREYSLSNFLNFAMFMQVIAKKYKKETVWCFKPHPLLKEKLYSHQDWGKDKTDAYYRFWNEQENTQYVDGDYIDLFKESNAMIHDSGSFLIEYLTQKKPVLYLISKHTTNAMNKLAIRALSACRQASNEEQIIVFIQNLLNGNLDITEEHIQFYEEEFIELYSKDQPSDKIIRDLKSKIFNN